MNYFACMGFYSVILLGVESHHVVGFGINAYEIHCITGGFYGFVRMKIIAYRSFFLGLPV